MKPQVTGPGTTNGGGGCPPARAAHAPANSAATGDMRVSLPEELGRSGLGVSPAGEGRVLAADSGQKSGGGGG